MTEQTTNIKIAAPPPPEPEVEHEMVPDTDECAICCDDFNKSTKKKVKCEYCNYSACKTCVRQYLTTTTKDPHCMNCKKAWGQHFMVVNLDRSYNTKEYKNHRKGILLESEISKLPETMEAAQHYQKREELHQENLKLKELENQLKEQLRDITATQAANLNTIYRLANGQYKTGEEKRKFIMACPDEDCRGFLSSGYKCELCKLFTCSKCHEIIGDKKDNPDHVCNPDSVKSAELIKSETKPCPSCGARIFKIDGCDQMWCTECHVAFSWRTGLIERGIIHNPHFYQWQRNENGGEAPRVPGDDPCARRDRMPNWWDFRRNWLTNILVDHVRNELGNIRPFITGYLYADVRLNPLPQYLQNIPKNYDDLSVNIIKRAFTEYLTEIYRRIQEIIYEKTRIDNRIEEYENNQEIRIHYLLKKISKEEMATKIIRRDTLRRKNIELGNIYDLLATIGRETFHFITEQDICRDRNALKKSCERLKALSNLREYCNEQFELISISHNCKVPYIHANWFEEKKAYKLSVAKKKASRKADVLTGAGEGYGEGDGEGGGEADADSETSSISSKSNKIIIDQSLPKDILINYSNLDTHGFEFTINHLYNNTDFPTSKTPKLLCKAAVTINRYLCKKELNDLIILTFEKIKINCKNDSLPKKPSNLNYGKSWPAKISYTITTESCGETEGVSHKELEYLYRNHHGRRVGGEENNASNWMSEKNEINIQWNGSCIDADKLESALKEYYSETDHVAKMGIEEALLAGERKKAYYLAEKSGKSETSDTLEGRILQGDWSHAEELARSRTQEIGFQCTTT